MTTQPIIGQLMPVAMGFPPAGWAFCEGQLLSIAQHTALFSILGTTYGGNAITTFGLPDLRGRVNIHQGQGPALSNYVLGQQGGAESTTLNENHIPSHGHDISLRASLGAPTDSVATGKALAAATIYGDLGPVLNATDGLLIDNSLTVENTGGGQPHNNLQPYLCINWCIALVGAFPSVD